MVEGEAAPPVKQEVVVEAAVLSKLEVVAEEIPAACDSGAVVDKAGECEPAKCTSSKAAHERDVALAKLEEEKRLSFIKAWEESEKAKVDNKAQKKICEVCSWENRKKAALESKLIKCEEELERKKAEYEEKVKNKIGLIHRQAEEKRAIVEAIRGEKILRAEEMAATFREMGRAPPRRCSLFGC